VDPPASKILAAEVQLTPCVLSEKVTVTQTTNLRRNARTRVSARFLRIEYSNSPIRTPCACKRDARRVFETNFPSLPSFHPSILPSAWQGRVASLGARSPPALCSISADYPYYCNCMVYLRTRSHARLPLPESATMERWKDGKFLLEAQGWILLVPEAFCTGCTTMVLFGGLRAAKDFPSITVFMYTENMENIPYSGK
jgi:hypothetical protein